MRYLIAATVATVAVAATPTTSQANTCSKAYNVRSAVVKKFGKRAPGRNICRYGVLHSTGRVSDATFSQKKRYLLALRKLNTKLPYMRAGSPRVPPAGTATPRGNLPYCTWGPESGGDYTAHNTSGSGASGKYQIIRGTWAAFGGTRYAPEAAQATPAQQDEIAAKIAADGLHHWVNC
jgi:hypothetical protein